MKFWRPGITGKLFLAIFATCIVLLISRGDRKSVV